MIKKFLSVSYSSGPRNFQEVSSYRNHRPNRLAGTWHLLLLHLPSLHSLQLSNALDPLVTGSVSFLLESFQTSQDSRNRTSSALNFLCCLKVAEGVAGALP